jgi:hypothetical protein
MNDQNGRKCCDMGSMAWWATLVIAVLAVPSFGVVAAKMVGIQGLGEIIVFVLACWLCTYLGMRLMSNPKMHDKIIKK